MRNYDWNRYVKKRDYRECEEHEDVTIKSRAKWHDEFSGCFNDDGNNLIIVIDGDGITVLVM